MKNANGSEVKTDDLVAKVEEGMKKHPKKEYIFWVVVGEVSRAKTQKEMEAISSTWPKLVCSGYAPMRWASLRGDGIKKDVRKMVSEAQAFLAS